MSPTPSTLSRWIPRLVIGTAILHFVVAFIQPSSTWGDIARDGFLNTNTGPERDASVWFLLAGFGFLGLGTLARSAVRDAGRLPLQIGGYLLAIGVPLTVIEPASGGPVLIVLGLLALRAAQLDVRRTPGVGARRTRAEITP